MIFCTTFFFLKQVGWIQAHPSLLKPLTGIGFINSGNNPVIFNSMGLAHFIRSGALKEHLNFVSSELTRKCGTFVVVVVVVVVVLSVLSVFLLFFFFFCSFSQP